MNHCEHCRARLLDYVYGLLEGSELQEVRQHLDSCRECQALLEPALAEQHLLATAAKAITEIPEFNLPASETTPKPATAPLMDVPRTRRPIWRRTWFAWTAAAVVLVAVGVLTVSYNQKVGRLDHALASAKRDYKKTAEEFAALPAKYHAKQKAAIDRVQANTDPYLHVVGPTTLLPGATAHVHIATRTADGTPTDADLRITLMEENTNIKLQVLTLACNKETIAELDARAAKPNSTLKLIVEAETGGVKVSVTEPLRTLAPTYATRVDTNKAAYQLKDVLFFRVVVLDRYTLTPPSQPIPMRVELLEPSGKPVRSLVVATGAGGVLASEFGIDEKFATGVYTLNVHAADASRADVLATSQRLDVVREVITPDFVLDKDFYLPGEELSGIYRGSQPLPEKAMIGPQVVPLTLEPALGGFGGGFGGGMPPGGGGGGPEMKKKSAKAPIATGFHGPQRFAAPIPRALPAGADRVAMSMKVGDGAKLREIRTDIPLAPTDFAIDFFPEGGDLIAGVVNRVYYRVRAKSGEPITGDGKVILLSSKEVKDSAYHLGMGHLTFIPDAKETYSVRITTPVKTETIANPFANLGGIRLDGAVVHVPEAVGRQGDAIRLTLRQQGPARKLLLVAQCRGQVVDQRWVEIRGTEIQTELQPTADAVGMIRVTAYELIETKPAGEVAAPVVKVLVPVAERLVYRGSTQRLDLGFKLNTHQLRSGQQLNATVTARDEKGQVAPAWLLASVVDERFQTKPKSLSAHFFLLNEIRSGADLDNAQLILHDSPESAAVLERFLGTHGWRRFVRTQEPSLGILNDPAKRPAQPLVFSRENRPLEGLQGQLEARMENELKQVRMEGFREQRELEDRVAMLADNVKLASTNYHGFQESVQLWIRLGLGLTLAMLLVAALVLIGIGVYHAARAQKRATPCFGSAFGCLVACMGILFVGAWLGAPEISIFETADTNLAAKAIGRNLDDKLARLPGNHRAIDKPLTGVFFQAGAPAERPKAQATDHKTENENAAKDAEQALAKIARRDRGGETLMSADASADGQSRSGDKKAMDERFDRARNIGRVDAKADVPSPPSVPSGKGAPVQVAPASGLPTPWVYQYAQSTKLSADTLLWHPTLWLPNGAGDVRFDMANGQATYRVLLLGHSPAGRFGFFETRLDVP